MPCPSPFRGLMVRHTPANVFVHRFAIGTAGATHPGLRPPLSKRGWRGSALLIIIVMRQPIPSRRGVAVGRGVSHCQTNAIHFPSPLRGSGEHADYRIALDCRRNASKRHHLNNPRQTKCSLGIRVLSLVSVSKRRHHINEFFACPETVFGRDQLRSLYNICTTTGAGIVRVLRFRLVAQFDLTLVNILGVLRGNTL